MRSFLFASILLFLAPLPAFTQEGSDSTDSPGWFSIELRGGANTYGGMIRLEGRFSLSNLLSIDAGISPLPPTLYGGISCYPFSPFLIQIQAGGIRVGDEYLDGPVFQSDLYGALRAGVLVGRNSRLQFSATVGGMMLVDLDYCVNCGFIMDPMFAPHYRDEVRWTPTVELGLGTSF